MLTIFYFCSLKECRFFLMLADSGPSLRNTKWQSSTQHQPPSGLSWNTTTLLSPSKLHSHWEGGYHIMFTFRENNVHVKYPCLLVLSMRGCRWAFYSLSVNRVNTLKFYNWNFWNNFKKASSLLHFKTIESFPGLVLKSFYLEGVEPFPFFFFKQKTFYIHA